MPLANRLRREGHEVQICIYNKRGRAEKYASAYGGVFDFVGSLDDPDWPAKLEGLQDLASDGKCVVITDSERASEAFADAKYLFPHQDAHEERSSLRVGAWVTEDAICGLHFLVVDRGAWAGGMGPDVDAGMTMIRAPEVADASLGWEEIRASGYQGLCSRSIQMTPDGIEPVGPVEVGWHPLHQHCFLSQLLDSSAPFIAPIDGSRMPTRFTVAAALSQPPWPNPGQGNKRLRSEIKGFTRELSAHVMWHDVEADVEKKQLKTLGLDGLVGVVHAGADSFELAQAKVRDVCGRLQFPAKQWRPDVGGSVRQVLALLEDRYGITI